MLEHELNMSGLLALNMSTKDTQEALDGQLDEALQP